MYFGKMTSQLEELYDDYYDIFGVYPDFYEEIEYGEDDYNQFVEDIKKAISEKKSLEIILKK